MNEKTEKSTLIQNLIAKQNTAADGSSLSPEDFHAMIVYLEKLEENFDPSDILKEQKHISEKVNSILESRHICLSADPAAALRQLLPIYESILQHLKHAWHTKEKSQILYTFDVFVDYAIACSDRLESTGGFAAPADFPFPVVETAQEVQLLTEENYTQEAERIFEDLSSLMDYIKAGLDSLDRHMIMTANEILFRLVSQANYILKNFL